MADIWRYHLPSIKGEGWAIAFLDSTGCFTVLSDWGNYGYRWPDHGWGPGDFRAFFVLCDSGYIIRKIARVDTYYGDRTLRAVQDHILERRRDGSFTRECARQEWDLLGDYSQLDSREDFALWGERTHIDAYYEFAVFDFDSGAINFARHVLPRLQAAIREELEPKAETARLERLRVILRNLDDPDAESGDNVT